MSHTDRPDLVLCPGFRKNTPDFSVGMLLFPSLPLPQTVFVQIPIQGVFHGHLVPHPRGRDQLLLRRISPDAADHGVRRKQSELTGRQR